MEILLKSWVLATLCEIPTKVVSDLDLRCVHVMHGSPCYSLIHLWSFYTLTSQNVIFLTIPPRTPYLLFNQGSLSHLIKSSPHTHGSVWPQPDVHWQYFSTAIIGQKSSLVRYFRCLHHQIMWSDFIIRDLALLSRGTDAANTETALQR